MSFYSVMKAIFAGFVRTAWRISVEGLENEPEDGAFLVCPNHTSASDPILLGAVLRSEPSFMAKKELLSIPLLGRLIKSLGAYPIDRKGNDVAALKKTIGFLQDGKPVIMFIQGTRCPGKKPSETEAKPGCAMIALRADVPILPVLIKSKGYHSGIFKKNVIKIGRPIPPENLGETVSAGSYIDGAKLVLSAISELDPDDRNTNGETNNA